MLCVNLRNYQCQYFPGKTFYYLPTKGDGGYVLACVSRYIGVCVCNDKVLKLFGRRVGLCVEWSDVNGVQVCCK